MPDEPPAIPGAAAHIASGLREPAPRLDRPAMPISEVERILGLGRRDFTEGNAIAKAHRAHLDLVRAAFIEGVQTGSSGFLDDGMAAAEWCVSTVRNRLLRNPPGTNVIGWRVISHDPRAKGRDTWVLLAIDGEDAWLKSEGVHLTVPLATCRMLVPHGKAVHGGT